MALPADTSPPPAGGDSGSPTIEQPAAEQPVATGERANADASDQPPAAPPGPPRLFFADEPEQREQFTDRPYGQTASPRRAGPDEQPPPGQPPGGMARPGQPARPGGPPTRPDRLRPARPPDRELRQRAIASLLLGVLSLVALPLAIDGGVRRFAYLVIFSAVIGVASVVIGITAMVKARRTGSLRPRGAFGGVALGAIAAAVSIQLLTLHLLFPRQVDKWLTCQSHAQSTVSRQSCFDNFYRSIYLKPQGQGSGAVRLARTSSTPARSTGSVQGSADGPRGRRPIGSSVSASHLSR